MPREEIASERISEGVKPSSTATNDASSVTRFVTPHRVGEGAG
jgi:hypothetical protein